VALAAALAEPTPCFMCSETLWWRCHRRLIAELLYGNTIWGDVARSRWLPDDLVRRKRNRCDSV
jgi:uncharacterized protein (DUF488 family)